MAYRVVIKKRAEKELSKLDPKVRALILKWMKDNLDGCDDPRAVQNGKSLEGMENGWRWRVGAYRILGVIDDGRVVVEMFRVGHRRDVYRGL